jgi:hypothetical protein
VHIGGNIIIDNYRSINYFIIFDCLFRNERTQQTTMNQPEEILREIVHEQVIVAMRHDGIVHVEFLSNTEINVAFQSLLVDLYNQITLGQKAYFIFEGGEFVSVTKEARENAIKLEKSSITLASAVVFNNLAQRILADFYYAVNRPKLPYKVFSSFEKGISWLNSIKESET